MGYLSNIKNKMFGITETKVPNIFLSKEEKLIELFRHHNKLPIEQVLHETGIETEHSLRTYLFNLRKKKIIFLKQKFGFVEKVKK